MQELESPSKTIAPRPWLPWLVALWATLWTFNSFRALRFPHPFAKGHWLFNYDYGFVKRGLPGSLAQPWIHGKTPEELVVFLDGLGLGIHFGSVYLTLAWVHRVLSRRESDSAWWATALGVTVFVLSPYVVSEANLCGYFDHLLVMGTIGAIALIRREQYALAGVVAATCMLTHEMFSLFGLPVLCFTLWLERADKGHAGGLRAEVAAWSVTLLPALTISALIVRAEKQGLFRAPGDALFADAERLQVIPIGWLHTSFHPLRVTVEQNMENQGPKFVEWLTGKFAVGVIHPTTAVLLALGLAVLWSCRRGLGRGLWPEMLALVAVVLVPNVIAAIGWDWARFMMLCHFHGLAVLLVIMSSRSWVQASSPAPMLLRASWGAALLASTFAIVASLRHDIHLTAPGAGVDAAFRRVPADPYACARPLFPNSDFSAGTFDHWVVEGQAFGARPFPPNVPAHRSSTVRPFGHWVGTYEASPAPGNALKPRRGGQNGGARGESDVYQGTLRSQPFVIEEDEIVFRVSGGKDKKRVHVRLLIAGKERRKLTGRNTERLVTRKWDTAEFRGKQAVIEIVDRSSDGWGHINAEGFCYAP